MRTIILRDLHLGNDGVYDVFAGADVLPPPLDQCAATPTRVILNGDTVDFLLNEDPLEMDINRAVSQAEAAVAAPATASVLRGLGTILAADASDAAWLEFLESCRRNPQLDQTQPGAVPLLTRFTGAVVEPHPDGGARLALVEWRQTGAPIIHGETRLAPATP